MADLPMITGITAEKVILFPWASDVSCVSNYPFECKTPLPLSHHFTFFGLCLSIYILAKGDNVGIE